MDDMDRGQYIDCLSSCSLPRVGFGLLLVAALLLVVGRLPGQAFADQPRVLSCQPGGSYSLDSGRYSVAFSEGVRTGHFRVGRGEGGFRVLVSREVGARLEPWDRLPRREYVALVEGVDFVLGLERVGMVVLGRRDGIPYADTVDLTVSPPRVVRLHSGTQGGRYGLAGFNGNESALYLFDALNCILERVPVARAIPLRVSEGETPRRIMLRKWGEWSGSGSMVTKVWHPGVAEFGSGGLLTMSGWPEFAQGARHIRFLVAESGELVARRWSEDEARYPSELCWGLEAGGTLGVALRIVGRYEESVALIRVGLGDMNVWKGSMSSSGFVDIPAGDTGELLGHWYRAVGDAMLDSRPCYPYLRVSDSHSSGIAQLGFEFQDLSIAAPGGEGLGVRVTGLEALLARGRSSHVAVVARIVDSSLVYGGEAGRLVFDNQSAVAMGRLASESKDWSTLMVLPKSTQPGEFVLLQALAWKNAGGNNTLVATSGIVAVRVVEAVAADVDMSRLRRGPILDVAAAMGQPEWGLLGPWLEK